MDEQQQQWEGKTYGNGWMHGHLISFLRHFDVRFCYAFAAIFIVVPCMLFHSGGRSSWSYYRRVHSYGRLKALKSVYMNLYRFAQVVIDRFAMYAGQHFDVTVNGEDPFKRLSSRPEAFIQLSSHIGNYEMAGYSLVSDNKSINAVVFAGEKASVKQNRSTMFSRTNINMIAMNPDMAYLFEIDAALNAGNIVSFPADRFQSGSKCLELPFMGGLSRFPLGPFTVAAMRGLDVIAVNVMKIGTRKYSIYLKQLEYNRNAQRRQQIDQMARAYVSELESMVRMYPDQWFNFYDFWVKQPSES